MYGEALLLPGTTHRIRRQVDLVIGKAGDLVNVDVVGRVISVHKIRQSSALDHYHSQGAPAK
ncbi:hypothetical protein SBDP1_580011 [Syntrophobacter sp. SbD1]|nr:hypothetical protein SBDP1_580011 [Syntrophobacter sp. SbD1]